MRRRLVALLLVVATTLGTSQAAGAHPPDSFTACAAYTTTSPRCYSGQVAASFIYGSTVHLRGRVLPAHPGSAQVWRLRPGGQVWRQFGTAPVSAQGRIRWSWPTTRADADQGRPYRFRFRIPGHGRSDVVTLYVLFGE